MFYIESIIMSKPMQNQGSRFVNMKHSFATQSFTGLLVTRVSTIH